LDAACANELQQERETIGSGGSISASGTLGKEEKRV